MALTKILAAGTTSPHSQETQEPKFDMSMEGPKPQEESWAEPAAEGSPWARAVHAWPWSLWLGREKTQGVPWYPTPAEKRCVMGCPIGQKGPTGQGDQELRCLPSPRDSPRETAPNHD